MGSASKRVVRLQSELKRARQQIHALRAEEARLLRKLKQLQGAART